MPYTPIEQHGLIGDMHTAALVTHDGTIDWLCLPSFDSPSVFAAILDDKKGGYFALRPQADDYACKQFYWPDTNVLITRFLTQDGATELCDFMPVGAARTSVRHHEIIRRVTAVRGSLPMALECRPAFDYARAPHTVELDGCGARFQSDGMALGLATDVELETDGTCARARFQLNEGESAHFVLRMLDGERGFGARPSDEYAQKAFSRTVDYWRWWLSRCKYQGRWRETVYRSLLTLKLLTYEPTGAIVAAPTCSLPEGLGGERNWDYRFSWVRDSAFTLYSFLRMGYHEEAHRYMSFLAEMTGSEDYEGDLQVMYGLDGRRTLTETTLDHLEGYRCSRPVRIGNGAFDQLQLDIYGELLDAIYLYDKWGTPISWDTWQTASKMIDWVARHWQEPDHGIWEVRGARRHFVSSKLMCWVAIDRGLRIARRRSFPCDWDRWESVRNDIYRQIMAKGWDPDRRSFVMNYGSKDLDASNLLMSLTMFTAPNDPRMIGTIEAIMKPPYQGGLATNSLVQRYDTGSAKDGLEGEEGTFNMCTFWLVEALTRAGRYRPDLLDRGRLVFERMLGFSNHLGLYAEETGTRGEALGNFPQAFTHLSLISAAYNLDRTLDLGTNRRPASHNSE
ncbi:MAG: glycoside hydrolase family 15 protein [Vicinamibacterales bacterium]